MKRHAPDAEQRASVASTGPGKGERKQAVGLHDRARGIVERAAERDCAAVALGGEDRARVRQRAARRKGYAGATLDAARGAVRNARRRAGQRGPRDQHARIAGRAGGGERQRTIGVERAGIVERRKGERDAVAGQHRIGRSG